MNTKVRSLLIIAFGIVILMGTGYLLVKLIAPDLTVMFVSTDQQEYAVEDTVHIRIQNRGDYPVDIYCPERCALGNFPTTIERLINGQWHSFATFCPSLQPIFERGVHEGDYVRHTLSTRSSFELEISMKYLRLEQDERLRIVYYLGATKVPIYSNEFGVKR